jgi:hypothetical protein
MRALVLVLAASVSLVAACVTESPGGLIDDGNGGSGASGTTTTGAAGGTTTSSTSTGAGEDPRAYFEANVKPIFESTCSGCHSSAYPDDATGGPDFLGPSPDAYYDSLVVVSKFVNSDPGSSLLLTRGQHTGPALDPSTQYPLVEHWLELEAPSHSGGGGFQGPTGEELLDQFSACMTLDDWIATGMPTVSDQPTLNGTPCKGCHASGTGGNYMTPSNTDASILEGFDRERPRPFLLNLVTYEIVDAPGGGQQAQLVQSYRWQDKGASGGTHPKYIFTQQQPKVDNWFQTTMAACFGGP